MWDLIVSVPDYCFIFLLWVSNEDVRLFTDSAAGPGLGFGIFFRDSGLMENDLIHGELQVIRMTLLSWNCSPY